MNPLIYFACFTGLLLIVWLFVVVLGHNRRVKRALRAFQELPPGVTEEALKLVRALADDHPAVTFLRPDVAIVCDEPAVHVRSHVGGVPYAEAGDVWPAMPSDAGQAMAARTADEQAEQEAGEVPQFVIQVMLDDPELGAVWQGRLIQVFLVSGIRQVVVGRASAQLDRYEPLAMPHEATPCVVLSHVRMPVHDAAQGKRYPASTDRLLTLSPSLSELLRRHARDPAGLLTQILRPNIYRYHLETSDMASVGGEPKLLQEVHVPNCSLCQQPMRFLFLFGDVIPEVSLGDNEACCVYGCDEHPEQLVGYLASY